MERMNGQKLFFSFLFQKSENNAEIKFQLFPFAIVSFFGNIFFRIIEQWMNGDEEKM